MIRDSQLTRYLEQVSVSHHLDLSSGYPQLLDPLERWHRYERIISSFRDSASTYREEVVETERAVRNLLGLREDQAIVVTTSGSLALARTLMAVADGRPALVTSPGFDSIYLLAAEATKREPRTVLLDPFSGHSEWYSRLLEGIDGDVGLVVVTNPDNPSGISLSTAEILELGRRCASIDATLVLDQSFSLVSPYGREVELGTILGDSCRWCVLWDTSKVVELAGEKLGFALPCTQLGADVTRAFSVTQFELPLPTVRAVRTALIDLEKEGGLSELNLQIMHNYQHVASVALEAGLQINAPEAGPFALLSGAGAMSREGADVLTERLLAHGVAVTPSSVLYVRPGPENVDFVRVGLAQSSDRIRSFTHALDDIGVRPAASSARGGDRR